MNDNHRQPVLRPIGSVRTNHTGLFLALAFQFCLPSVVMADSVVVFNEIMYHPRGDDPEWIELHNQMGIHIDLSGWSLTGGIEYTFPEGTILHADSYLVVASAGESDPLAAALPTNWAGTGARPYGPFEGRLANSGEEIRLVNNSGRLMNCVHYRDEGDWPVAADGSGVSLAKIDPARESETPSNWTWSGQSGGTPGYMNFPNAAPPQRPLRFNEICPAAQSPAFVEIVNVGTEAVMMTDVRIARQGVRDAVYTFGDEALDAGALVVLTAGEMRFAPASGDRLFLYLADGSVSDAVSAGHEVTGRHPDGMGPWLRVPLPTPGQTNAVDVCTDIVINEIMYHPLSAPRSDAAQESVSLFDEQAPTRVLVPQDDILGRRWTGGSEPFDDRNWIAGVGTGVGFETGSGYEPYIDIDVRDAMLGRAHAVYVRIPFVVVDPAQLTTLTLKLRYDDGFLAFLNGVLVASANMAPSAAWNDPAAASHSDAAAVIYEAFDISNHRSHLKAGVNILAIQGHNASLNSTDLLFGATLEAAQVDPATVDAQDSESGTWVELYNKGAATVDLSGWEFDKGISYTFPDGTSLAAGGYLVVARDHAYLASLSPDIAILGDFEGRLARSGEELRLVDAQGNLIDQVRYYDGGTWPQAADGGGSSLELRDPRADNNCGSAWAPSDELGRSAWQPFSYRGIVQASPVGNDSIYREFVMGLLDAGEILIDDIHVIEDPDGAARELLQNSDFTRGMDRWRIIGNHRHSDVELDPDDPTNPVLRLVAVGPTDHLHNHAETTFANNAQVANGRDIEIRFRARWVSGSPLLHTRLFFNRLPRTTVLPVPARSGTPGQRNSRYQSNIGPTLTALRHSPVIPSPDEPVTVSVEAGDPDGVAEVALWYRSDNGTWQSTGMSPSQDRFVGWIPGHAGQTLVQFYVQARDPLGQRACCPPDGEASFAQYHVSGVGGSGRPWPPGSQGRGPSMTKDTGVFDYHMVMRAAETEFLYEPTNRMSNEHLGATLIVNERDVYYDVGVRLKGSEHGRPKDARIGFHVKFSPEKLFRGVHESIGLDRSDGQQTGQREMLFHMAMNRFGGFSKYHDLGYLIAPRPEHSSGVEVQLARYGPVYCQEAYGDEGGSGTVYEYELIYTLAQTVGNNPEALKIPQEGGGVYGRSVSDYLGTDKEKYRWHFLIKNNRDMDDYEPVMNLTRTLGMSQSAFAAAVPQVIDVDQWLRAFAMGSTCGIGDNWIANSQHNAMFYFRPTDRRFVYFLHDLDYHYEQGAALERNDVLRKLLATPRWAHAFYAYVYELLQVSFNRTYLSTWAYQGAALLPEQGWLGWLDYIDARHQNVMSQLTAKAGPPIPFAITSPSNRILPSVSTPIRGRGWLDVQEIRIVETGQTLTLDWSDLTTWEAYLPDDLAPGPYTLAACGGRTEPLATDTILLTGPN